MLMMVRAAARSFAYWICLATVAGSLMLLAGCSDSSLEPRLSNPWFEAVGGTSANDVYAVESSIIWHYDGRRWAPQGRISDPFLNSIWAPERNDAYFAWSSPDGGLTGKVYHFDGSAWRVVATAPAALQSVWGTSGSDVYAVGRLGTILHYDGGTWRSVLSTGQWYDWLEGIWGSSPQDVYVA